MRCDDLGDRKLAEKVRDTYNLERNFDRERLSRGVSLGVYNYVCASTFVCVSVQSACVCVRVRLLSGEMDVIVTDLCP